MTRYQKRSDAVVYPRFIDVGFVLDQQSHAANVASHARHIERSLAVVCPRSVDVRFVFDQQSRAVDEAELTRYQKRSRAVGCRRFVDVRFLFDQQSHAVDVLVETRCKKRSRAEVCARFVHVRFIFDQQLRAVDVPIETGQMKRRLAVHQVLVGVGGGPQKTQDFVIVARLEASGEFCLGCLCRKSFVFSVALWHDAHAVNVGARRCLEREEPTRARQSSSTCWCPTSTGPSSVSTYFTYVCTYSMESFF